MTLIKELIEIPEHVQRGDFVLRLSEGVNRPEETIRDYVVTPELKLCFDDALSFIRSSLQTNTSKASYLHGSFGSGKSHFMAVLHLILQGNPVARGIPELASVIAKHNDWIGGKKFLLVPYHMIGSHDMESGILGGYVDFMRRTHPNAPIPGVYLAEGLFKDADNLRKQMGDEKFFKTLNEGRGNGGGWGELEAGWDIARFELAMTAEPGSEERSQLISALVSKYFGSYDTQAGGHGEAFVTLDKGLSVLSKHAKSLGYDGLILFLDELILWLASHAAELTFVHQEGQKLAKLVEAQTPDRPIPIISFVARQRDLSELIGDSVPGAERVNFSDALKHWEGRFHTVTLEDRNLPAIAEKRILKRKNDLAQKELDSSFEQTAKIRESVMNVLLTSDGDREMFRKVYPFSPALVKTLIAVSSVLQRERTALKVMMQLLVDQRDTLELGEIVPVGDLFDVIAHGDEAFSQDMAIHFENAKRLYHQKLLPVLEKQHGRRESLEQLPYDNPKRTAFRNDDRLVKTLLLSALVPEVESLRALNAERLAALNHGTIKTPIPGREAQEVLRRCRTWAASVGEIRVGEETNPTITVQLSGVDTESIIAQARREDNQGNRIRLVRQMFIAQLGIEDEDSFAPYRDLVWRNTQRSCVVLVRNIRDLPDASFENIDDRWKLVIDPPFDEMGHGPRDDLSKLQSFSASHPEGTKTICWIPAFLSSDAQKDLGMLVILRHILIGERFAQYSSHLSPQDRPAAKSLLENQRSVLEQRVQAHLDAAYGVESLMQGSLDTMHDLDLSERFVSLWPGFDLQPPVAANLRGAMDHLVDQALSYEFPAAPFFEAEIKRNNLIKVNELISAATQTEDGRLPVDKLFRPLLRHIANPLLLGEMGPDATHFVIGQHWKNHFGRKAAEIGGTITVGQLRRWLDDPKPMGLPKEVQNLVILTYAQQTSRSFFLHGAPYSEPDLTKIPDACELREQKLPDGAQWKIAIQRAGSIFGFAGSPLRNGSNVNNLCVEIKKTAESSRSACQNYCQKLRGRLEKLKIAIEDSERMRTASTTQALIEKIRSAESQDVVGVLATAAIVTSEAAMGECLRKSAELTGTLDSAGWDIFDAVPNLPGERRTAGEEVVRVVREALQRDEHVVELAPALRESQSKALRLLTVITPQLTPPIVTPPEPKPQPKPGKRVVTQGTEQNVSLADAKGLLSKLETQVSQKQEIHVNISWIIEESDE